MDEPIIKRKLNFLDLILTRQILLWSSVVRMLKQGITYQKARQGILQEKYNECLRTGKPNLYYAKGDITKGELGPQIKDARIYNDGFPLWLALLLYLIIRYYWNKRKKNK